MSKRSNEFEYMRRKMDDCGKMIDGKSGKM